MDIRGKTDYKLQFADSIQLNPDAKKVEDNFYKHLSMEKGTLKGSLSIHKLASVMNFGFFKQLMP